MFPMQVLADANYFQGFTAADDLSQIVMLSCEHLLASALPECAEFSTVEFSGFFHLALKVLDFFTLIDEKLKNILVKFLSIRFIKDCNLNKKDHTGEHFHNLQIILELVFTNWVLCHLKHLQSMLPSKWFTDNYKNGSSKTWNLANPKEKHDLLPHIHCTLQRCFFQNCFGMHWEGNIIYLVVTM